MGPEDFSGAARGRTPPLEATQQFEKPRLARAGASQKWRAQRARAQTRHRYAGGSGLPRKRLRDRKQVILRIQWMFQREQIIQLSGAIKKNRSLIAGKKITAGFDGFIDSIVKIIKDKQEQKSTSLFKKIKEFGAYITEKAGASFSLELEEVSIKSGGNMPNLANALGRLGAKVNCVGALGYPQTHAIFKTLPPGCQLYSFAEPGTATALEFNDGKIMLAQMGQLNHRGWNKIKNIIGIETLITLYKESDMYCIVNWSEIDTSTDIWKGLLKDVIPACINTGEKKTAFFDLSDCSKRSDDSIKQALLLLKKFTNYTKVILSLNKNEAGQIYRVLFEKRIEKDLKHLGGGIFEKLKLDTLLLHSAREAIAFNEEGSFSANSFFIDNPSISTGAGDNFNAGFCIANLLKLDPALSVMFANCVAALYVKTGTSPELSDTLNFLEEMKK
jgi:sugar/nucleoside kinase (ribokinase family)